MYERNLIDYIPEFLKDVNEYKAILNLAEQPEMVDLFAAVDDALNDQFIVDATENGVLRWEKILNIVPKATATLDERKFAILTKVNEQTPYTMTALKQKLDSLCGEDGYDVELDSNNYVLKVKLGLGQLSNFMAAGELLKRIVPANMIIELTSKYNKHQLLADKTHKDLSAYTHYQLRNEVVT